MNATIQNRWSDERVQSELRDWVGIDASHAGLADAMEAQGFTVVADPDDNEHSFVTAPGQLNADGSHRWVAEIRGDANATLTLL